MNEFIPPLDWTNLLIIPSLLMAYTVHELGHAFTAYFLGDYSQVERGKITLNPLRHIAWFGALAFVLFGIGWPKPLQANPYNFKRKYLDMLFVAIAGPVASLGLCLAGLLLTLSIATVLAILSDATIYESLRLLSRLEPNSQPLDIQAWAMAFTSYIAVTSFWLTFVSLLPLPGLDGFAVIMSLVAVFRERAQRIEGAQHDERPQNTHQQRQLESTLINGSPILMSQRKRRNMAADIHFKLGTEYHQENKYDDAIARYRQAINNDQHFGPAYINMGLAYLAKGQRKRAIQAFRGAVQYADDKKSQTEAWYQLHQLSEITPVNEEMARKDMAEMGDSPWTDTQPRPNWLGLAVAGILLLVGGIFLYSYFLTQLIEVLKV
ncbi:site-2 protease family protein [Chloroflexota bacterium]